MQSCSKELSYDRETCLLKHTRRVLDKQTHLEDLETKDVLHIFNVRRRMSKTDITTHKNSYQLSGRCARLHRYVDLGDNPLEQVVIDRFCQRIPCRAGLRRVVGHIIDGTSTASALSLYDTYTQGFVHECWFHLHEITNEVGHTGVSYLCIPVILFRELDVAQPENDGKHAEDFALLLVGEANNLHCSL